jgi:hypothetical protein
MSTYYNVLLTLALVFLSVVFYQLYARSVYPDQMVDTPRLNPSQTHYNADTQALSFRLAAFTHSLLFPPRAVLQLHSAHTMRSVRGHWPGRRARERDIGNREDKYRSR